MLHHLKLFSRISHEKWLEKWASLLADPHAWAEILLEKYEQPHIDKDMDRQLEKYCRPGSFIVSVQPFWNRKTTPTEEKIT